MEDWLMMRKESAQTCTLLFSHPVSDEDPVVITPSEGNIAVPDADRELDRMSKTFRIFAANVFGELQPAAMIFRVTSIVIKMFNWDTTPEDKFYNTLVRCYNDAKQGISYQY